MIFLIRHRNTATGKVQDVKMSAPMIALGSDLDQHLYIPSPHIHGRHALIKMSSGKASVKGLGWNKILVNGQAVYRKVLQVNDEVKLGDQTIKVLAAPEGFDFACEMTLDPVQRTTTLAESWQREVKPRIWTPRRLAYFSAVTLFVIAFWLP